jgi:GT2 family glycosyltransferase
VVDRASIRRVGARILPPGTRARAVGRFGLQMVRHGRELVHEVAEDLVETGIALGVPYSYQRWFEAHRASAAELDRQRQVATTTANDVSILCVVGAGAGREATIASLEAQTWSRWRLGELGDAGPDEWLVLLRAGDRLEPDALFRVADLAWTNPELWVIGWDDDVSVHRDRFADPRFRPEWSPDTLLSANYLGRSVALRADVVEDAGGLSGARAEDLWDLFGRLDLDARRVGRIPAILAHLEEREPEVPPEAASIVQRHLDRLGWPATAEVANGAVRLRWRLDRWPSVSIVIPSRHNTALLEPLFRSLAATDYPGFDVVVVDNSGPTDAKAQWYRRTAGHLDLDVVWWERPFNFSAVCNAGVAATTGEVVVLLNDDTEMRDPMWLTDLVGWASRPEVGVVGAQLLGADGTIQHGGVMMGLNGLAEHLFAGMEPHSDTVIGSTDWTRTLSAVTGACVAVRREVLDAVGGLDERFELTGSDVALCLDAARRGYRTVCVTGPTIVHLESATRANEVPARDVFTSWWRFQRWITGGDPFVSPSLSRISHEPRVRWPTDPDSLDLLGRHMGRSFRAFRQSTTEAENLALADRCRVDDATIAAVRELHDLHRGPIEISTVAWFIPDFDSPFYGGINTILRLADHLRRHHDVTNRFVVIASPQEHWIRSAIAAAFPDLAEAELLFVDGTAASVRDLPPADVGIATIWHSAFALAHAGGLRRKAYLIQDYEPGFYPAGTLAALAEESYHLGLYGICNSPPLGQIYRERFGGTCHAFTPAVDSVVFHARRPERSESDPLTVFLYARPGHWRNCWEIASLALRRVKERFGRRVRLVTAGSWASPEDLGSGIEHLGMVEYASTGDLYRRCDIGIALTTSAHPSYLPLELMACGVPVVAFDQPGFDWALRDGENSLLAHRSVDGVAERVERLVEDEALRQRLAAGAIAHIAAHHASWDAALGGVYPFLVDPSARDSSP